jgi:hypothetical protein
MVMDGMLPVKWNGTNWQSMSTNMSSAVNSFAVYKGQLIAGGDDYWTNYLAYWNGSRWVTLGGGTDGTVTSLLVFNDKLVVAGAFSTAGNVSAGYVALWDGTNWQPMGNGLNSNALALTVFNDQLVVGGQFTAADGHAAGYLAQWGKVKGDLNCNDWVNLSDLSLFAKSWLNNCSGPDWCSGADIDASHKVDYKDMQVLVQHWLSGI